MGLIQEQRYGHLLTYKWVITKMNFFSADAVYIKLVLKDWKDILMMLVEKCYKNSSNTKHTITCVT